MKLHRTHKLIGAASIVVIVVAWLLYSSIYAKPRDGLLEEIDALNASIEKLQKQVDSRRKSDQELRAIGATTLGSEIDVVDNRLRTGLNRIMEQEGLANVVIDTREPREEDNPLRQTKGVSPAIKKILSSSSDFVVVRATVKATGGFGQVTRALAVMQSQPWIHRVDSMSLRPMGRDRDRFELRVDVASLFVPDLVPKELPDPQIVAINEEASQYLDAMGSVSVFAWPKGPPKTEVQVAQTPGTPPPLIEPTPPSAVFPPYEDWALSGVMKGRTGLSIIMVNRKSGESRALFPGDAVLDAVFIDGSGERAVFEIGGKRFEVSNGDTLASRRPIG